ncbi:MAG: hypothetical protein ACI8VT_001574 [Saprospiraceae bacterium]|jgi:hypothetical protein
MKILFYSLSNLLFLLCSCGSQKSVADVLQDIAPNPKEIIFENNCLVNNEEGHIQGVQFFNHKRSNYYFFTGSSNNQSYYAIADADHNKILSVNKFLDEPYRHPGGFQIANKWLAVGIEDNIKTDKSKVLLFKILDPKKSDLKLLKTIERSGPAKRYTAGCVALTKQKKNMLIAVGNWDTKNIDFYSIPSKRLKDPNTNFNLVYSFDSEQANRENWIEKTWYSYQNINFVKDAKKVNYLIGTAFDGSTEMEIVDVFEITTSNWDNFELRKVGHRKFKKPATTTLGWGGGVYQDKRKGIQIFSTGEQITDSLYLNLYLEKGH